MVDASGQPKILDFGVARLTNADAQVTHQTTVGKFVGTVQYMIRAGQSRPRRCRCRSDVYSLGVILYD